jgi:flagellin
MAKNATVDVSDLAADEFSKIVLTKETTDGFAADVDIVIDNNLAKISWQGVADSPAYTSQKTELQVTRQGVDVTTAAGGINAVDLVAGKLEEGEYRITFATDDSLTDAVGGKVQVKDGANWKDLLDSDGNVYTTGPVATTAGGNYSITFKDASGNEATLAFQVAEAGLADGDAVVFKSVIGTGTGEGINVSKDTATAQAAITTIDDAIKLVSEERAKLGAVQNRLEHTIKNLDTSSENLQASESRIRDVDMAKEMMEFTKNNILQQAAQAMLAQANQAPQGVLQLLR